MSFFAWLSPGLAFGQSAATRKADSLREVRTRAADSLKAAREHVADSLKTARQHRADSIQAIRQHRTDSIAAINKYKNSKKYKDSVAKARKGKPGSAAKSKSGSGGSSVASARADSMREARKVISDSIALARKTRTDSVRAVQKHRTDSLAKVQKYKTSKRYADSVTIARRIRSDSIKAVQKEQRDNIAAIRKHSMDSAKGVREHYTDSVKTVRTKHMDSLKVVRKAKTDSLAKAKSLKDKLAKEKVKKKEDDMKLKLEIKLKQKREAWSNKNMLKKKWTPVRAFTQNGFTHYNYYYNANRKMEEAETNMRRAKKESFDSLINLFPFDPNKDSSLIAADMDSIIHKVSVGIQIHDPRVKWSGDLYLLLGQAYYYKGSYENAAIAFQYIIAADQAAKRKGGGRRDNSIIAQENHSLLSSLKHKSVHNEAVLWLARTYTTARQLDNTASILSLLESDTKLPEELKGKLAIEKAFAYITERNYDAASAQLDIAVDDPYVPDWLRVRAAFLNGQIKQNREEYLAAAESFERVLDFYPKIEMDFYTRKNIASNKLMASNDAATAMVPLKKILSDGKYSGYYDQVYYVLGRLAIKANKPDEAITYLTKSTAVPKASKKQKGLSFAALGDVYYSTANYSNAKRAYDSASKYSTSGAKDVAIAAAVQRSKALSEISGPANVIHDQDSLLEMATLSKREQAQVARAYIKALQKHRQDSVANAEAAGVNAAKEEAAESGGSDATAWYFSNPTLMAQGSSDFKRKWGNRPLVDNWRRQSAIPLTAGVAPDKKNGGTAEDGQEEIAKMDEDGLPTEASLLSRVPNTAQQKESSLKTIQNAYMKMAKAYFTQLEDYNQTLRTLDTLNTRFPNHSMKEEELYLRYQVAVKQNQLDKAKSIAQDFVARFPNSPYASQLKPNMSESTLAGEKAMKSAAEYFDETYRLLQEHQYTEVLMRADLAKKQYSHPRFSKRFEVLEASAYAGKGDFAMADSLLSKFIKANPADTLAGWARNVQDYVKQVRNGGKPAWYDEAMKVAEAKAAAAAKAADGTGTAATDGSKPAVPPPPPMPTSPRVYSYQPDSEHYAVVVLPGLDSRSAALKQSVKSFDKAKDSTATHEVLLDLYDITQAVLVIRKFTNATEAKAYSTALMASPAFSAYKPEEVKAVIISRQNYKKMFADKDAVPYFSFFTNNYK